MKTGWIIFLYCAFAFPAQVHAQGTYMSRSGEIKFFSTTPVEDIEAVNNSVTCILSAPDGELAFKLFMKSFAFERAAMQEHFNKDYVHSDEFPKATFDGRILNFETISLDKEGRHNVQVEGNLTIHGVTRPVKESGSLEIRDGRIVLDAVFRILLSDYNVKVPSNFVQKISKEIEITLHAELEPYQR